MPNISRLRSRESTDLQLPFITSLSPEHYAELFRDETFSLLAGPEQDSLTTKYDGDRWQLEAEIEDFDDDPDIVDPEGYYIRLENLEYNVVRRSELFRGGAFYSLRSEMTPDEVEKIGLRYMPSRLFSFFSQSVLFESDPISYNDRSMLASLIGGCNFSKAAVSEDEKKRCWSQITLLWRSYIIISNVDKSIDQLRAHSFCQSQINALLKLHGKDIVEIKSLPIDLVEALKYSIEVALEQILHQTSIKSIWTNLLECALTPCMRIWQIFGSDLALYEKAVEWLTSEGIVEHVQLTTCLLDAVVVSYAGSHASDFFMKYMKSNVASIKLTHDFGNRGFHLRPRTLACLNEFVDGHEVWVFEMQDAGPNMYQLDYDRLDARLSVLTRIQDLADIWGPVWTISARSDLIKRYDVSKGMICPVEKPTQSDVEGAIVCHYINRASYDHDTKTRPLLANDVLLIGAGLHTNLSCSYEMADFAVDHAHEFGTLGTKPEAWKTDYRSLTFGISKIVGLTVSGTQKLIPQTSLKQRILDKWTNNPSRANPAILNQFLGVQISHCAYVLGNGKADIRRPLLTKNSQGTGNARRISLKELLLTGSVLPILERQTPGWTHTAWGSGFLSALKSDDPEAVFHMWMDFANDRTQIAALVCDILDLLDSTGQENEHKLHAAHLANMEESTIAIDTRYNDWSLALRDTHLMAAYVIMDDICLESDMVGYKISSCGGPKAFTVLQTHFTVEGGTFCEVGSHVKLEPSGYLMKRLDSCIDTIISVEMSLNIPGIQQVIRMVNLGRPLQKVMKSRNRSRRTENQQFYIWALRLSFNGIRNKSKQLTSLDTHTSRDDVYPPNGIPSHGYHNFDSIPMLSTISKKSVEAARKLNIEQGSTTHDARQYHNNKKSTEQEIPPMAAIPIPPPQNPKHIYAALPEKHPHRPPRTARSGPSIENTNTPPPNQYDDSAPQLVDLYGSNNDDMFYDMKVYDGIDDDNEAKEETVPITNNHNQKTVEPMLVVTESAECRRVAS